MSFSVFMTTASVETASWSLGMEHALLIVVAIGFLFMQAWFTFLATWLPKLHLKFSCASDKDAEQSTTSSVDTIRNVDVVALMSPLPADICGRIACLTGFQGVAQLGACCKPFQSQFWDEQEIWKALSASAQLPCAAKSLSGPSSSDLLPGAAGWEARHDFRRAFFRTDLSRLHALAAVGRSAPILVESTHVACGLLPGDLPACELAEFIQIATRCLGAHDPENSTTVLTAERLLRAARRHMELFTEEQLDNLEYTYKSVHQLHALMTTQMKDSHVNFLEQSFWHDDSPVIPADDFSDFFNELCQAES